MQVLNFFFSLKETVFDRIWHYACCFSHTLINKCKWLDTRPHSDSIITAFSEFESFLFEDRSDLHNCNWKGQHVDPNLIFRPNCKYFITALWSPPPHWTHSQWNSRSTFQQPTNSCVMRTLEFDFSGLFRLIPFLTKLRSLYKEKNRVKHSIQIPHREIDQWFFPTSPL